MIEFDEDRLMWEQVRETLIQRIMTGVYRERRPIPSINQLDQELPVSRGTIRKVLAIMAEEGWINPLPGRGTYVRPRDEWPERE